MDVRSTLSRTVRSGPPTNFTGAVFLDGLAVPEGPSRFAATLVTFTPGARTIWHSHCFRQVLVVTAGAGIVQVKGEPPRPLLPGDVAIVPPDVEHWHGAIADSLMAHLSILETDGDGTSWLQPVAEADYTASVQACVSR